MPATHHRDRARRGLGRMDLITEGFFPKLSYLLRI